MRTLSVLALTLAAAPLGAALAWEQLPQAVADSPRQRAQAAEAQAAEQRPGTTARVWAPRLQVWGGGRAEAYDPDGVMGDGAGPELGLRASANLWRGGRDKARRSQRAAEAAWLRAQARAQREELLLQARLAWLEAWSARARATAYQAALSRTAQDLARVRRQTQAGLLPRSDGLALEILAAELDQHVFDQGHLADEAEHHVAALLGLAAPEAEGLAAGQALDWPAAPLARSSRRAEQAALEAGLQALRHETRALGGDWQPGLDLEAQARQGRPGYALHEARDWQALAALSLAWDPGASAGPEMAWLRGRTQAQDWRLRAQMAADQVKLAELDHALISWLGRREAVAKRLQAAQAYRQVVLEESGRGVRDAGHLAESNQAWLEAELDAISARQRSWTVWSEREAFEAPKP